MKSSRYFPLVAIIAILFTIVGCTEDPDAKAAREARTACEKAIAIMQSTGDVEKAQAALAKVPISQLRGKDIAGLVAMIKGSMLLQTAGARAAFGNADSGVSNAGLSTLANREAIAMSPLADKLFEYKRLEGEKARLQKTIDGARTSLAELKTTLAGTNNDGLEPQLAAAQAEEANLEKEKAELDTKADEAIEQANKLQAQAQEMFNQADQTTGEERERLRKQGYDILLGKDGGESKDAILMRGQTAMDEVSQIESKARIARARVDSLSKSVQSMKEQIPALEKTATGAALKGNLDDIGSRQAKLNSEIGNQLGEVEKVCNEYNALADAAADLYKQAGESFASAASGRGGTQSAAKLALADSKYRAGMMLSSVAATNGVLGKRALVLSTDASDGYTIKKLEALAATHTEKQKAAMAAAVTLLGEACEAYKGIQGLAKEAKCAVVASNVYAYLERIRLATMLRDKTALEGVADELKNLNDRGTECNEKFAETTAGKMLALAMKTPGSAPAVTEGVKSAALEQAKNMVRMQLQQMFALPEAQRPAAFAVLKAQAVQSGLSSTELAAVDAMITAGTVDEGVVSALAVKVMTATAQALAQSPEAMKQEKKAEFKQALQALSGLQGEQRQALENSIISSLSQLGLSEAEMKQVKDMLASGKADDAVIGMVVDKAFAAVSAFSPDAAGANSPVSAPARNPMPDSATASAPEPAKTTAATEPSPAPADANSTAAPAADPNSAAK